MKPGPLPDLVLGKADAPITIVEYASMTCGHCASFHNKVLPALKQKYIDTGKVRLVMREFPLDNLAAAASMLARCAGGDKTFPLISALFAKQEEWAFVEGRPACRSCSSSPSRRASPRRASTSAWPTRSCSTTSLAVRRRAADEFGVSSTPTFFINGKKLAGGSLEDFEKAFAPLLKS